jgi:hypothetical protein
MGKQDLSKALTKDRLEFFLDSRNGAKDQCLELLHIILLEENDYNDGWVPFQIIKKHMDKTFRKKNPYWENLDDGRKIHRQKTGEGGATIPKIPEGHLKRLLDGMIDLRIVKRKKETDPSLKSPNKDRIFYQCSGDAITPIFTPLGMVKDYPRLYRENIQIKNDLEFAICFIEVHGLSDEYDAEVKKRKLHREKWKNKTRAEINREIRNMTPEEYQEYLLKLEYDRKFYLRRDVEKIKKEIKLPSLSEPSTTDRTQ